MSDPGPETALAPEDAPPTIFTIGHSTRPVADFIALLHAHGAEMLVDVRTVPHSRHNPQFDREALARALDATGIGYLGLAALGGLRKPAAHSPNTAWRNAGFRGFADHMASAEFAEALSRIEALAEARRIVLMCAEAMPWRCHRSLIADALTFRNRPVRHIVGPGRAELHRVTPFACFEDGFVTYPASAQRELDL